jgi:hypothetical protein
LDLAVLVILSIRVFVMYQRSYASAIIHYKDAESDP